jgi:hypothetical protein
VGRIFLVAIFVVACSATPTPPPPTDNLARAPTASLRTEDAATYRTECATRVLSDFISSFNRGDSAALTSFFSTTRGTHPFQWFVTSDTPRYGPPLNELANTLAGWHASGQRWRLVSLESGAGPSWHGGVDFELRVERSWPDHVVINTGKGALDCAARTIFVLALGDADVR